MKRVFKQLLNFKLETIIIFITVVGYVFCILSLPNYLSNIIDIGIINNDTNAIIQYGLIMLGLTILGMILSVISSFFSAKVSMGLSKNIRDSVFKKIQIFSTEEFDKFSTSSLITRTNNDVTQIQNFMMMFLRITVMSPIMCVGGIIMAFNKDPSMSNIIFLSIPILIILVSLIAKKSIPLSILMQKKIDRINLVMREKLTGIRVMRAFITENHESERFKAANSDLMHTSLNMQRTIALMEPVLMLILNATTVFILWIGYMHATSGDILSGDIIAVIQYVMQIMMSITMMSVMFVMYPRASASASRIDEVMDTNPTIIYKDNIKNPSNLKGYVEFKNVTFKFTGANDPAVKNVTFKTSPGETTAIIGSTGSGKSTLIKLILRLYDVSEGEILIDGINVKEYGKHELRSKIGYVPQKALLFKGSIKENILMGDKNASDSRIEESAKISQAYDFIIKKDENFNSKISQGGTNVSGGQRQRLSIARAIVRRPEIYIFDDSFSALDFKTESELRKSLSKETQNSAVIIVAQRVSTIINSDRIIVMDEGNVVGIGKHADLIKSCKTYREIVHSQLSDEEAGA